MVVRNLPANASHLRGSSSKSNCKRDEIPFIVLGWMQRAGAPEAALALPRNVPADGHCPAPSATLGHRPCPPRGVDGEKWLRSCHKRIAFWKGYSAGRKLYPALPAPLLDSRIAWESFLPGSGWQGAFLAWQELFLHGRSFPGMAGASPAAAALTLPQLSSCTAKKEHPTKPTLNESPVLLGSTDTRGGSPGLPRASSTCPWRAGGPFVPPRAHILRPLVPV